MANEMRDRLRGLLLKCNVNFGTTQIADHLIENGVVPVVRCRECKHCGNFKDYNNKTIFKVCLLGGGLTAVPDNHYCGYGERK